LALNFEIGSKGALKWFLGINVDVESAEIKMHQGTYAAKLLKVFGLEDCKPKPTPMTPEKLEESEILEEDEKQVYMAIVGSLIYMTNTRPDIAFAVNFLARYMATPTKLLLAKAKHVLRYLKGTLNDGVTYRIEEGGLCLEGYSDADWAGDPETRRSTTGYLFRLGSNTAAVTWRSQRQKTIAHSSAEAEYIALHAACQENEFLKHLLSEFKYVDVEGATKLFEDNQAAIKLSNNPAFHSRTKHIDLRYHIIREYVAEGRVELEYVPTEDMLADMLTKPLPAPALNKLKLEVMSPSSWHT